MGFASAAVLPQGVYDRNGQAIYVGVEHELPDPASNDFFDPQTQHTGSLAHAGGLRLRTGVQEERRVVVMRQGHLGVSLYFLDAKPRSTVILVHGNDPETREMGFLIPYFVTNGVNVISYDQRGTGESTGNWFLNGPIDRANDVDAIYDAFRSDPHVDGKRIGIWGFSNGGWTAPIVAVRRPLAFMILKSAPAESLAANIDYEVRQVMRRHGESAAATQQALALWRSVESALNGTSSWTSAQRAYSAASSQPWFRLMPKIEVPPKSTAYADGLRRAVSYDPAKTLQEVRTPTLALYGALDRNVDVADSSVLMPRYFAAAGMRDFTMRVYQHAGHQLIVSTTGYNGDALPPERFVPGYPEIMLSWLEQRGFMQSGSVARSPRR